MKFKYRWWGKGDVDASIGIFFDGFSKILSATGIMLLCSACRQTLCWGRLCPVWAWPFSPGTCGIFTRPGPWPKRTPPGRDRPALWHRGLPADGLAVPYYGPLSIGRPATRNWLSKWGWRPPSSAASSRCWGGFIGRWIVKVVPHSALMGNMASSALVWALLCGHRHGV